MHFHTPTHVPADERPGLLTRLAIAALTFALSILLGALAAASPASAQCGNG